jgi:hypothetical protein
MQMKSITSMELHKISSYSSPLYFLAEPINTLRLVLPNGSSREITHPQLSRDFVSGRLEDSRSQGFFRRSHITSVEFLSDELSNLPELVYTRKTVGEQLLDFAFPVQLRVCYRQLADRPQKVIAVGLFRGFLVTDFQHNLAIPLAALSAIEVECV